MPSNSDTAVLAACPEIAMTGAEGATISRPAITLSTTSPTRPPRTPASVRLYGGRPAVCGETSDDGFTTASNVRWGTASQTARDFATGCRVAPVASAAISPARTDIGRIDRGSGAAT